MPLANFLQSCFNAFRLSRSDPAAFIMRLPFPISTAAIDRRLLSRLFATAAFISLSLGCKSSSNSRSGIEAKPIGKKVELSGINQLVHQTVRDPARAEGVIRQIEQAEKDLGGINKGFEKREKKFGSMVADHKTKGSELEIFLHEWQVEEDAFQRKLITTVGEVKRRLSPEEWSQIAPTLMDSIFAQSDRLSKMTRGQSPTHSAPYTDAPVPAPSQIPPPAFDYAPIAPAPQPGATPDSTKPYSTTLPPMPNLSPPPTRSQTPAPAFSPQ